MRLDGLSKLSVWILFTVTLFSSVGFGKDDPNPEEKMKIKVTVGQRALTATLLDSETSRAFVSMLPLVLNMKDYAGTEKVGDLPNKLPTTSAPAGYDPSIGDITYYAPWGNLAVFYRDFGYAQGLVKLGRFDQEIDLLVEMKGEFEAIVERVE